MAEVLGLLTFEGDIKSFRRIATRYDKTDTNFAAMIYLAGTVFATR
jgi:transposase